MSDDQILSVSHIIESGLSEVRKHLPLQGPLADFIALNPLQNFLKGEFHHSLKEFSLQTGSRVYLSLKDYLQHFENGDILETCLKEASAKYLASKNWEEAKTLLFTTYDDVSLPPRLRNTWKRRFNFNMSQATHPTLYKWVAQYLDQGISIWRFPHESKGFWATLQMMESNSYVSILPFQSERAKKLFTLSSDEVIAKSLELLLRDPQLYSTYIFETLMSHFGWTCLINTIEHNEKSLRKYYPISLKDVLAFELLLEVDTMSNLDSIFTPIQWDQQDIETRKKQLENDELWLVRKTWQDAYENSYHFQILKALEANSRRPIEPQESKATRPRFQSIHCIDDRECSIRRQIEAVAPDCQTYGTPGFFGVEFYFKGKTDIHLTKLCPAPVTPQYLIIEKSERKTSATVDRHYVPQSQSLWKGWLSSQVLGFTSVVKLASQIFKPTLTPATATSLTQGDDYGELTIYREKEDYRVDGLYVGFTHAEMAARAETLLKSIGLTHGFAPFILLIGHGGTTVNNPHYAAYDCGACSGRPGSLNARVMSTFLNNAHVRSILSSKGIQIPDDTLFIPALHDTTRDEMKYFFEHLIPQNRKEKFSQIVNDFVVANALDAKERIRRFTNVDHNVSPIEAQQLVATRSVSIFETRPEYTHSTNCLCIVGSRQLTRGVMLDRRAFLNSYDFQIDPDGKILTSIMNPALNVCGGINLQYYFSKVDPVNLSAGTKLPHNIVSLLGVSNGVEGDLRMGLPSQMVDIHHPLRLMLIVQQPPSVALQAAHQTGVNFDWIKNDWVKFACVDPHSGKPYLFESGQFKPVNLSEIPLKFGQLTEDFYKSSRNASPFLISEVSS